MGVVEQLIQDAKAFTSNTDSGAGAVMTFTAPDSSTATVAGVRTTHWNNIDEEGKSVNAKKAGITVNESLLTALNYPVRNSYGHVDLKNHKVKFRDANGVLCEFIIREWYPDETLQLITCVLGDFE